MSKEGFDKNPPPERRHTISLPCDREDKKSELELVERAKSLEAIKKQSIDYYDDSNCESSKLWKNVATEKTPDVIDEIIKLEVNRKIQEKLNKDSERKCCKRDKLQPVNENEENISTIKSNCEHRKSQIFSSEEIKKEMVDSPPDKNEEKLINKTQELRAKLLKGQSDGKKKKK